MLKNANRNNYDLYSEWYQMSKESQPAKTRLWQKSCHNHFFRMNSVPKGASSEISFIITYDLPIILPTFTSYRFRLS